MPPAFGDSDQLEVGELAVAIGNPMGKVHGSVTAGIISAVEQELTIDDVTINAIQTDAAINPGNSGGALFDSYGNVIGVVYAKSSSVNIEGIGYAIPVNNIKELVEQMINDPDSVKDRPRAADYAGHHHPEHHGGHEQAVFHAGRRVYHGCIDDECC